MCVEGRALLFCFSWLERQSSKVSVVSRRCVLKSLFCFIQGCMAGGWGSGLGLCRWREVGGSVSNISKLFQRSKVPFFSVHKGSVGVKVFWEGADWRASFHTPQKWGQQTSGIWLRRGRSYTSTATCTWVFPPNLRLTYTVTDVCLSTLFLHMRICPACLGSLWIMHMCRKIV